MRSAWRKRRVRDGNGRGAKSVDTLFAGVNGQAVGRLGNGPGGKDLNLRQMKWKSRWDISHAKEKAKQRES